MVGNEASVVLVPATSTTLSSEVRDRFALESLSPLRDAGNVGAPLGAVELVASTDDFAITPVAGTDPHDCLSVNQTG